MACILVVDDRPINREFLATLLGYLNHEIVQAADGAEALKLATALHPDLVITDVLMPVMDGVEFVRRLRADPAIADTPVIFYTATYRLGDAWQLARSCGVDAVIGKPASPQAILEAVAAKLGRQAAVPQAQAQPVAPGLLGGNLSAWMASLPQLQMHVQDLQQQRSPPNEAGLAEAMRLSLGSATTLSLRLAALLELGMELGAERDLGRLLDIFVRAARDIMSARYAASGLIGRDGRIEHLASRGLPDEVRRGLAVSGAGILLERVLRDGEVLRLPGDALVAEDLPAGHPPVSGLLALPVRSLTRSYGWLYFAGKLGDDALDGDLFSEEDEQIATVLATKLSLACENLQLFGEVQGYARELEIEVAARRESETLFRELAENIREVFWLTDPGLAKIHYVSPTYEEVWGRSCASLYAEPGSWRDGLPPEDRERVRAGMSHLAATGLFDEQFRVLRPDGSLRWVRSRGFPIRNAQGELLRIAGLAEDVTQKKLQEDSIARLNRVLAVLSGINSAIVRIHERQALFDEACRIAVENGRFVLAWIGRADGPRFAPLAWRTHDRKAPPPQTIRLAEDNGHAPALGSGHVTVCDDLQACCPDDPAIAEAGGAAGPALRSRAILSLRENGAVVGVMVLYAEEKGFFDAEEVRLLNELAGDLSFALDYIAREDRLNYLAYYDALTGLPNRRLFLDRVAQLLHAAGRDGGAVALILLDIDHFKQINDSFGRHVGDALLKQIAERLAAALEDHFSLTRVGADIFAIAVPARDGAMVVLHERIFAALAPVFSTVGGEVQLTARAGLALYPGDGDTAETLFSHAEIALGQAKASGDRHCYYDKEVNARVVARLALETELRQAVSQEQFVVYFQPKVSLESGRVVGAEALVRWRHPERGVLAPGGFIALAEESGLIVPLGEWVLRNVCEQQARWLQTRLDVVPVAVNLSAVQFHAGHVVDMVRAALADARLDPRYLELELTESVLMRDPEGQVATLAALRQLGVGLSLDDFGTGYSSLAYLKRYPFSAVKIDRAFIVELTHNPEDAAIADATIGIARRLGMRTIAEGVETEGQMHYLCRLGCDEIQGYLFSQPVPAEEFAALLRAGKRLTLPSATQTGKRTLLLVDDEPHILSGLRRVLRRDGYRVLTAGSGREGLDLLAVNEVQVIISDQRMAGMSGAEFLSVAKELYPDTIRIILSGYTDLQAVTDAVNHGAVFKFLSKPWDDDLLRENVRDAFRRHRPLAA